MKSKYIIFDVLGLEVPVVFCPVIQHEQIKLGNFKPVAAGFCRSMVNGWECWGKSVSLNLDSRPREDEFILNKHLQRDC